MRPELVIFDCDGVLVDSEALSVSALLGMIELAGGTVSEDAAYEHFLGKSMKSVREILGRDFGLEISDQHLTAMRVDLMRKFREELKPIPGVRDVLPKLGLPCCVASSGTLERIRYALDVTGLLPLLEPHLFSATMVKRGKPEPDLFLHAAASMRAHPRRCLVVEDSPAGVVAARSAGMRVLAFTGGSHASSPALKARLASTEPDFIFADMLQLPDLIAGLGAREKAS
ncbi:HAD family hydrolase [Mesorhizobium sp. M2D.F.Ca.ET.185.01.1.1]|uniref:HAD family hydrolase n=1 Tax=unclassified Mesorhizobium TaxID=325217 RepID=UPI000FCC4AB2|nr:MULTISPECIES: HAD family hydrolase [unclassified Mesorhizobium]TGP51744.1 HAD family hydrolase [bacterium M00.F.Ca.ET.230.01.1.1]TGP82111.1 HAD family hydrolase [bacterium M00.F.Ca.ET.227.01.1.1]TGP92006.1 HAD family hydrolase [bacterium M00.F.Ca.ET.221.01.1.1]TGP95209.1 HAD family hydrolase [bacterium M00.F.Ca.ET.222.01.1.1]TGU09687.1 HAD family hydrolase [bacterium M00.F.Ca.ET.163.01.1.1]TGU38861.1 HAD family hydrolase [bacterium M00.F.Ca.ET.156.01.1.1]TGU47792.1 HAD family hydrolase [b